MAIRNMEPGTSAIGSRACSTGPAGPNGYGGTLAKRGGLGDGDIEGRCTDLGRKNKNGRGNSSACQSEITYY